MAGFHQSKMFIHMTLGEWSLNVFRHNAEYGDKTFKDFRVKIFEETIQYIRFS